MSHDKRRGFLGQRKEDDIVPPPGQYEVKTVFEENKNKAFLIDRPRQHYLDI